MITAISFDYSYSIFGGGKQDVLKISLPILALISL